MSRSGVTADGPGRATPAPAALWASAFVILALIITQAGRIPGGVSTAQAGVVSTVNDYTVLTASGGDGQDNLILLDQRAEKVLIYSAKAREGVRLMDSYDLKQLFDNARRATVGSGSGRP
ncbi:MAG: hypothetical protein H6813_04075 [Phycisphaeraceae bacterium]|nr:hypothetical protein [Phycisphaeraceae bacterium]MCB9847124.1 hypothetical protein [Phycisphaeraceae bacterium]